MGRKITDEIHLILSILRQKEMNGIHAFLGFDACIDNIVRVVKEKKEDKDLVYYTNSRQFGEFLISRENRSCGIELRTKISKIGGNMVITANALGNLGMKTDCIGTFGLPEIQPIFRSMSANCSLYTVGETIITSALEFNDAKVMMFDPGPYDKLDWTGIKNLLGIDLIKQLLSGKQLVAFLNWSEIENSSAIWEGILDEILPSILISEVLPNFIVDFSDCSRRSTKDVLIAISLMGKFRNYYRVIVSMNQNEAEIIADTLGLANYKSDEDMIKMLFHAGFAHEVVIHRTSDALAYDGINFEKCSTFFCKEPTVLTGGGDNFNAGFCFARTCDLDLLHSLIVANAVSGYYVRTGTSPDKENLIGFLKEVI